MRDRIPKSWREAYRASEAYRIRELLHLQHVALITGGHDA